MVSMVGVIGSRSLPGSFSFLVGMVVRFYLSCGFKVVSGGAVGADSYALSALLRYGAAKHGVIFSAWQSVGGFPASVQPQVSSFIKQGGEVVWGPSSPGAARKQVVSALLGRNRRLVSACSVVVAFLHGSSRGSLYTIWQAASHGIPVVVFLCGNGASLPVDLASHCLVFQGKEVV